MLTAPGRSHDEDIASPATTEGYAQQVPAQGTDVREWCLGGWWWRVNGALKYF